MGYIKTYFPGIFNITGTVYDTTMQKFLVTVVVIAALVRLAMFGAIHLTQGSDGIFLSDSWGFYQTGLNIVRGNGFSQDPTPPFEPGARFPPLYPGLIALSVALSNSVIPLVLFQIILSSLAPVVVWKIGRHVTEKENILQAATLLTAFEPLSMFLSIVILTDVVAVFLTLLGILYLLRYLDRSDFGSASLAALFMGLSALTRPEGYYITLLIATTLTVVAVARLRQDGIRGLITVAAFVGIFFAIISPWLIRNYVQFGTVSIATTGVRNVYSSLATSVVSLKTGDPVHVAKEKMYRELSEKYGIDTDEISTNPEHGPLLVREGLRILSENPKETLGVLGIAANSFFTQDLYTTYLLQYKVIPQFSIDFSPSVILLKEGPAALTRIVWERMGALAAIPLFGRLFWITLTSLLIAGIIFAAQETGRARLAALTIAGFILIYAAGSLVGGFSDYGRHRYRVDALIFILAAYGGGHIVEKIAANRRLSGSLPSKV